MAKENKFLCIKGGVSLTHVDDVANGIIKVCENGSKNGRYILSGHNISFERLVEIKERFNKPKSIILPTKLLKLIIKILGKYSPIDNAYAQKVIGSYSWYKCPESLKIGYKIRPIKEIIDDIEIDIRRELRLNIFQYLPITKNTNATKKYNLLITGFPGWLGNRMLEKIIKNENIGISRDFSKIKLLVQKKFIKYLPKLQIIFKLLKVIFQI